MKIIKTFEKYNQFLNRNELVFILNHISSETPKLYDVRKELAEMYNVELDVVYIKKLETLTCTNKTNGEAEVYDTPERARRLVPKHIQLRNLSTRKEPKNP